MTRLLAQALKGAFKCARTQCFSEPVLLHEVEQGAEVAGGLSSLDHVHNGRLAARGLRIHGGHGHGARRGLTPHPNGSAVVLLPRVFPYGPSVS